jgi:hypothetical protein
LRDRDNDYAFRTYSHYVQALDLRIRKTNATISDLARDVGTATAFTRLQQRPGVDAEGIGKLLRLSWYTEQLLVESGNRQEFLQLAIPWTLVYSYYAVDLAIRAYFLAFGRQVDDTHAHTLRAIAEDVTGCKGRFPCPWCCVLSGDTRIPPQQFGNGPCTTILTIKNALRSPYYGEPCQYIGLFLKTTRIRELDRVARKWRSDHKKKRLPPGQRALLVGKREATTIFHFLYRVRARTNYKDIDMFMLSSVQDEQLQYFHSALCTITSYSLMLFEMLIARELGRRQFGNLVEALQFSARGQLAYSTVSSRWRESVPYI